MKDWLIKHRNKIVTLVLMIAPLAAMFSVAGARDASADPGGVSPGGWLRAGGALGQAGIVATIGGSGSWLVDRLMGESEIAEGALQAEIARLREEKARLIGVLQENARLRALVGFRDSHPTWQVVPARVVAQDTTPYFRVITVRVTLESDGAQRVRPGMPVIVAGGVVGQVHGVFGRFAEVVVLSDPRSRVDVVSQRNRAHGLVQGLGHDRDYLASVAYVSQKDRVEPGDVMVTSGMGGVFPAELIVGHVVSAESDERGLFQKVMLEPAVDVSRLGEVFIVTSAHPGAPAIEQDASDAETTRR